jgi:hypothetical protein
MNSVRPINDQEPKRLVNERAAKAMLYEHAPISFVLNWYTPTPTATDVKRNVQVNKGPSVGNLRL